MPWFNPYRTPTGETVSAGGYIVRFPLYLLWTLWGFLVSWSETREYRRLWQGLGALVLAGVLVLLFVQQGRPASRELVQSYVEKAQHARRVENYELADFYFRKLEQLAPDDTRIRFDHALLYADQEDYGGAAQIVESLVRDDNQSDDQEAHRWLAQTALEGKFTLEDPLAFAKHHLNQLLEDDPHDQFAHYFYSQLFLRMNDLDNAIRHLESVNNRPPELQMQLASLYGLKGDRPRSRSLAQESAKVLEEQIRDNQSTDVSVWLRLAGSYLALKDFEGAVRTLNQAVTKFDNETCRKSLGRTYVYWSDEVLAQDPDNIGRRMELLQRALQVAPDEPLALQRIINIAATEGPAADKAKAQLQQALAEGKASAAIHFTLGTMEASKGNMDAALRHLDQAQAANPHTAVTLNNLAFVLAHAKTPHLERALEVSNQALRIAPNVAAFRETRGQILTALGRHAEALTDLEFALPKLDRLPTRVNIHHSISTCYEQLGDADLARIHDQKAEELQAELTATEAAASNSPESLDNLGPALEDAPSDASSTSPPGDSD